MSQELIPAVVTPIKDGKIDIETYKNMLLNLKSKNINTVVALGSTGEGVGLFPNDFKLVADCVKEAGLHCILCVANPNPYKVLEIMQQADADSYMLTPPFTTKAKQEDIVAYYKFISDKSGKNLVIYNNVARFDLNITWESYQQIIEQCNIVGIKECAEPNDALWMQLRQITKQKHIKLYAGDDDNWMKLDVDGCISVIANIIPEIGVELSNGNLSNMENWQKYCKIFTVGLNPANIKYLLARRNQMSAETFLAFKPLSQEQKHQLDTLDFLF